MNPWRHIFFVLLCLTGLSVSVFPISGEESGFRQYRENLLKEIEEIKAALQKEPEDSQKHFQLGLAYMALGRHEQEIAEYLEAVRLEPDFADAHFNLGLSYDLMGDGVSAMRHMQMARQIYSAQRNHRGIRTSQRYLRTFTSKYGIQPKDKTQRK